MGEKRVKIPIGILSALLLLVIGAVDAHAVLQQVCENICDAKTEPYYQPPNTTCTSAIAPWLGTYGSGWRPPAFLLPGGVNCVEVNTNDFYANNPNYRFANQRSPLTGSCTLTGQPSALNARFNQECRAYYLDYLDRTAGASRRPRNIPGSVLTPMPALDIDQELTYGSGTSQKTLFPCQAGRITNRNAAIQDWKWIAPSDNPAAKCPRLALSVNGRMVSVPMWGCSKHDTDGFALTAECRNPNAAPCGEFNTIALGGSPLRTNDRSVKITDGGVTTTYPYGINYTDRSGIKTTCGRMACRYRAGFPMTSGRICTPGISQCLDDKSAYSSAGHFDHAEPFPSSGGSSISVSAVTDKGNIAPVYDGGCDCFTYQTNEGAGCS